MVDSSLPFELVVYDKQYRRQRQVAAPISASFTPRFNGIGTGELILDAGDPANAAMQTPGARLTCAYRGQRLDSGRLRQRQGDLVDDGTVTYEFRSDYAWLGQTLGWVIPTGNLTPSSLSDDAQAYDPDNGPAGTKAGTGYYPWPAGVNTAESALKNVIAANFTRLGRPYTMAADQGRGGNARTAGMLPNIRFDYLSDVLADLLDWSGLGLSISQATTGAGCVVDVWTPRIWVQDMTVSSGVIPDGTYTATDPEGTRIVLGSNGEDAARAFWGVNDTTGLESTYGDIVEVFRDATGAELKWSDDTPDSLQVEKYYLLRPETPTEYKTKFISYLNTEAAKGLADGVPTSGLDISLAETDTFHFHGLDGFHVGDQITVKAHGQSFTERITEATVTWASADGGDGGALSITPQVGPIKDDPTVALAQAIANLAAAQRRISAAR